MAYYNSYLIKNIEVLEESNKPDFLLCIIPLKGMFKECSMQN